MLNEVRLIGHVGNDTEVKEGDDWNISTFSLATTESWKDKDSCERKTATEWHNIVTNNNTAKVVSEYVKKRSFLLVCGKLKTRTYEKDGDKRYITEIYCSSLTMLGKKDSQSSDEKARQQVTAAYQQPPIQQQSDFTEQGDDLPF